jgi:uncharacterized membrane protein
MSQPPRWLSLLVGLAALAAGAGAGAWVMRGTIATAMTRHAPASGTQISYTNRLHNIW